MIRNILLAMSLIILLATSVAACSSGGGKEDVLSEPLIMGQEPSPTTQEQVATVITPGQNGSTTTPTQYTPTVTPTQPTSSTIDLASISLADCLSSGKFTLAEFGWKNCIPCKRMKPILEEMAMEYKGVFNVVIVEVYSQQSLTRANKITSIPTQIIFNDKGKEVYRHVGYWDKENILAKLNSLGGI